MHRIVLPDLVRLLARVGARRMGDPELPVVLAEASVTTDEAFRDGALRAGIDASASAALHVFNGTRDRDDGRVLGARRREAGPLEADDSRPLMLHAPGLAWLRITLEADAEALARATGGALRGRAEAGRNARLLCYRRHRADDACGDAIGAGLARFASALSLDDVRALGVGDACVVQAGGTLSTSLSVSWSALLSAAVPAIAEAAGGHRGAFLVEMPAAGKATLALSIDDGYSIAFARQHATGDRAFRVMLRRHGEDDRRLGAALSLDAGFADPAAVARVLAGVLADALDAPADALRTIREATSLPRLPSRHRVVAQALIERFGIAGSEPLQALRDRLADLDERFAHRIETLAGTRAALALETEYRRLASDTVLLEAELSEAALCRLHPVLLALDTRAVLADAGPGRTTASLLHDRVIEHLRGWSIGASLGSWFELASAQRRKDRLLERRRADDAGDRTRREYLGRTDYTARANGWSTAYGATFEAADDGGGNGTTCALQLWWEESRLRADPNGLARIVDDAVLWGVVAADAAPALLARLRTALGGAGRCRPRFELGLEDAAARAALGRIADADPSAWARSAARALPRNARIAARADCATREAIYAPVFAALDGATGSALRRGIGSLLRDADARLAARERKGATPWTAWQVLRQAGMTARGPGHDFAAFAHAASRLHACLEAAAKKPVAALALDTLGDAFSALRPAFEQPFTLRTIAGLLAGASGGPRPGARLELAFERDGRPRSLLVAA